MTTPAGWFPDPSGADQLRYWDGANWSEHVGASGSQPGGFGQASAPGGYGPASAAPGHTQADPYGLATGGHAQTHAYGQNAGGPGGAGLSGYAAAPTAYSADTTSAYGGSGGYAAPGTQAGAPGSAGYYGPASAPPSPNQTPVIVAVAVAVVLVIAVAVFFAYGALTDRGEPGPTAGPTATSQPTSEPTPTATPTPTPTAAPTQSAPAPVTLGATTAGTLPADGTWDGVVTIAAAGVYAFIGHAEEGIDLTLTLLDGSGQQIAFNDDPPGNADVLVSNRRDPLLGLYLEPGEYTVRLEEYGGYATEFDFTAALLDVVTEIPTGGAHSIAIPEDNVWLGYVPVSATGMVTVDVRTTTDADPVLTVISPDGTYQDQDDRGSESAAQYGGSQWDPYLTFPVEPGVYLVMVSDWTGAESEASIAVTVD
ncbi:DUF2510 domain-containing protein [Occultella aeris]|uniref:DUF2510 domain-containing protein n=1 Tax=Occultella aeris TaxID=2761496 RepID=A0A7M4DS40_9MICO|nr:DUF2510 domain-containing protein [Occultella aeris]VZO40284.1 hypothetical protein HALOF300_04987 [Occultella aeris]